MLHKYRFSRLHAAAFAAAAAFPGCTPPAAEYYVVRQDVRSHLNGRKEPRTSALVIQRFRAGDVLQAARRARVRAGGHTWVPISVQDKLVWVAAQYLRGPLSEAAARQSRCLPEKLRSGCLGRECEQGNCGNEYQLYFLPGGRFKAVFTCHHGAVGTWKLERGNLTALARDVRDAHGYCAEIGDETARCSESFARSYGRKKIVLISRFRFVRKGRGFRAVVTTSEKNPIAGKPFLSPQERRTSVDVGCVRPLPETARQ